MSTQRQHSNTRLLQPFGLAAALLLCVSLGACTAAQTPTAAPPPKTSDVTPMPFNQDLDAGTYLVTKYSVPFEITVPDGWVIEDDVFLHKDTTDVGEVFLLFQNPTHVPTEACQWSGTVTEVERSVDGFADALAAQTSTETTAPVDVVLGDYRGVEFDLTVESDIDINTCDQTKVCIHSRSSGCERWYQDIYRTETYRVLDLAGDRAVMSLGNDAGVPDAMLEEARTVFDSIRFVPNE